MEHVKISIIVPVYNVEKYLKKCLMSLTEQTLDEIEIICINDGSTDESGKILDEFAKQDSRIIVLSQENKGVSAARNKGIKKAIGEYIAFVDSDDYIEMDMCEKVYNRSIKYNADITVFGGEVFTEDEITDKYLADAFSFFKKNLDVKKSFWVDNSVNALMQCNGSWPLIWNKIYRRNLVLSTKGFSEDLSLGEDEAFLFAIYPLATRILYIEEKYYHYLRNRIDSATDRLVLDFERRAFSNLKMANVVKQIWKNYGILETYEQDFLNRYINLLFESAESLDFTPKVQKKYMQEVFMFLNTFQEFSSQLIASWFECWRIKEELYLREKKWKDEKEVINQKINYFQGQAEILKELNLRPKRIRFKNSKLYIFLNSKFLSPYLKNIVNIFKQINANGLATYIKLKNEFGENCVLFTCAIAGLGDAYIVGCFIEQWLEQNEVKNFRFLLCKNAEKRAVEELFPYLKNSCTLITQKEHEWLRNLDRICNFQTDFYFFHHYDYMQGHLQITEELQGYRKINMKDLYLFRMGLPIETKFEQPKPDMKYEREVKSLFQKYEIAMGKTIVIAPYSTCLGSLNNKFWQPIIVRLQKAGYNVCCNCSETETALKGTIKVNIEFKYLLLFIESAGGFIGFRSGLCDLVSSCKCKMAVIHPYNTEKWGTGNSINYVGIENMGWNDEVLEVELEKDNKKVSDIQEKLINYFGT